MTRVKICCIQSPEEARTALRHGADLLGLVSAMPSGPGPIPDAAIRTVVEDLGGEAASPVRTVLLTSLGSAAGIAVQHRSCGTWGIQICDRLPPGSHRELRELLPGIHLIQVIHVRDEPSVEEALLLAPEVDALLLDSGNQDLAVRELGGTGRTHDWALSRRIVEGAAVPVLLAGGLRPENVAEAVGTVRPWGVDVCTGVRSAGRLDAARLARFVRAVREAG